eukprot:g2076.t1
MSMSFVSSPYWIHRPSIDRTRRRWSVHASSEDSVIDWIRDKGGFVDSSVQIEQSPKAGWYLKSQSSIVKGSLLVSLPKSCQIFNDDSDPVELQEMIRRIPEEFWTAKLSLKLLLERIKGERSSYSPYLRTLPVGLPGAPIFFSPVAVKALEYPPLIQQINKRCKWLVGVSELDRKRLFALGGGGSGSVPDMNLLGWALAIVSSRAFRLEETCASMLPLIDICNHSFEANCKVQLLNKHQGDVKLIATNDIKDGEPLMLNYGNLGNDELLLDYGFFVKDNPFDYIELNFTPEMIYAAQDYGKLSSTESMNENQQLMQWKQQMLEQLGLFGKDANPSVKIRRTGDVLDGRLIAGARILLSKEIIKDVPMVEWYSLEGPFDRELNLLTLRTIGKLLFLTLGQFSDSVKGDVTRLKQKSYQDPNEQMAIEFRIEKKHLLVSAINFVDDFCFAVLVTDPRQTDNPIVFASASFFDLTGYTASEVLGRNCRFLQGPDTERRQVMEIRDSIREERPCKVCLLNYKKNGEKFWNQLYIEPVFNDDNQVWRYVGIQTDVTRTLQQGTMSRHENRRSLEDVVKVERAKATEVSRRISESQDRSFEDKEAVSVLPSSILASLERIQQSFVLVDPHLPDMPIVHAGESFVRLTGYPRPIHSTELYLRNEIIGRNCRFLQGSQTDRYEVEKIRRAIKANPPQSVTATLLNYKYDGTPFWNALHISPVRGSNGEIAYFVGVQLNANEANQGARIDDMQPNRNVEEIEALPRCGKIGLTHQILHNGTIGEVRVAVRSLSGSSRGLRRSLSNCKLPEAELDESK